MSERVIGIDVETARFKKGCMAPEIICLSVADHEGSWVYGPDKVEAVLTDLLRKACLGELKLCGHNVSYDFACVLSNYLDLWPYVFVAYDGDRITCTGIRERLLDISIGEFRFHVEGAANKKHGYDLGDLAERRLGRALDKDEEEGWRLRFEELKDAPIKDWPKEAIDYSREDAVAALELYRDQEIRARQFAYSMPTQFEDTRADLALRLMSVWGVMADTEKVEALVSESLDKMKVFGKQLSEVGLATYHENINTQVSLNGSSQEEPTVEIHKITKEIRAAVERHHPNPPRTEKGNIKTDAETLAECNYEPFEWLTEFNSIQKTLSTYLSKMGEPPIHASFFAIGAESDRTSCARPNLQNQPRLAGVRECFIPRDGFVFLDADYSTQEMRTLAQSCLDILGTSRLAEKFKTDVNFDPHMELAKHLARGNPDADLKKLRQRSKAGNFGFPAGMSATTFLLYAKAYGLNLKLSESEHIRNTWFRAWPEMRPYFNFVSNLVNDGYGVARVPQSGFVRAKVNFKEACNTYFQTLAAHASKTALWEITKRAYFRIGSYLYGSRPVMFVHDEILLETPEEAGHEAAIEMEEVMVRAMERWTPDVPSKAEAMLMRYWSKDAKRTFENGRLIPWGNEK